MRLKDFSAAVAAFVVIGVASSALAAPVEDEFVQVCLASKTAVEASAKAKTLGYVATPPPLTEKIRAGLKGFPDDGEMLWRADEGEVSLFIGAAMTRDMPRSASQAIRGDMCMIASMPAQRDLQTKIERILDVGRAQPFGNDSAYIFEQTAEGRVRLDGSDRPLIQVKVVQGSARMATAIERTGMSGLVLMIPRVRPK